MLFLLNFPAEPPSLQYALGGLIVCGLYLLVTRGRALRRHESQPLPEATFVENESHGDESERRAA